METSVRDFSFYQETICNSMSYPIRRQEQGAGVTIPEEELLEDSEVILGSSAASLSTSAARA